MDELERIRALRNDTPSASAESRERARSAWSEPRPARRRVGAAVGRLIVAGVTTTLLVGAALVWVRDEANDVFEESVTTVEVDGLWPEPPEGPVNFLLVGVDTRVALDGATGELIGPNADTVMLVQVRAGNATFAHLTIPRDLLLGGRKVAHIRSDDGIDGLVTTVESELGVAIHHYVEVDMSGFAAAIDEIGGVDLEFDRPIRDIYSGLEQLEPGCSHFDGSRLLTLVRSRHFQFQFEGHWNEDPFSDLARTRRNSLILGGIFNALVRPFETPFDARSRVAALLDTVVVDRELRPEDLVALVGAFRGDRSGIVSELHVYQADAPDGSSALMLAPDWEAKLAPFRGGDLNPNRAGPAVTLSPSTPSTTGPGYPFGVTADTPPGYPNFILC